MARPRRPQPLLIRITHAVIVVAFGALVASGLEIWSAYPFFGPRGATYDWIPLQGREAPTLVRLGDGLAGARQLHLAVAWVFVLDALIYVAYLVATRQWRQRYASTALYSRGKRALHVAALVLAAITIASGFALWKPVQLAWLAAPMGGFDGARVVHHHAMLALVAVVVAHVIWVVLDGWRHGWRKPAAIVTGGAPQEAP